MITHRKEKFVELFDSGIFSSNRNLETVKKKHISEELIYRAALFIASRHREAYSAGVFFCFPQALVRVLPLSSRNRFVPPASSSKTFCKSEQKSV